MLILMIKLINNINHRLYFEKFIINKDFVFDILTNTILRVKIEQMINHINHSEYFKKYNIIKEICF